MKSSISVTTRGDDETRFRFRRASERDPVAHDRLHGCQCTEEARRRCTTGIGLRHARFLIARKPLCRPEHRLKLSIDDCCSRRPIDTVQPNLGTVSRGFTLASDVDEKTAVAKLEDGVLRLTLPKQQGSSSRVLKID